MFSAVVATVNDGGAAATSTLSLIVAPEPSAAETATESDRGLVTVLEVEKVIESSAA